MNITNYKQLATALGVSEKTLRARRRTTGSPTGFDLKEWQAFMHATERAKGQRTASTAATESLRDALMREQARKEKAIASLKELELEIKEKSLMPESTIAETIAKICTPLRRLLDALPRAAAAAANPSKPMLAEHAIRNALNERVFGELQKVMQSIGINDPAQDN